MTSLRGIHTRLRRVESKQNRGDPLVIICSSPEDHLRASQLADRGELVIALRTFALGPDGLVADSTTMDTVPRNGA